MHTNIVNPKRQIATDIMWKFPVTPNKGKKYLFVLYEYNRNRILVRHIESRTYSEFIQVLKYLHDNLFIRGLKPCT